LWEELEKKGVVTEFIDFDRLQLDLLNPGFSWDDVLYFNDENVPLETIRQIVAEVKREFIDREMRRDWYGGMFFGLVKKCFTRVLGVMR
jgi:hypothetical protein